MSQSSRMLTAVQHFASAAWSTFGAGDVIELVVGIVVQHKHPQRQAAGPARIPAQTTPMTA